MPSLKKNNISRRALYKNLLTLLYRAKASHIGSSLSCLDMLYETLVFQVKKNDVLLFSKGHAVPALYTVLHAMGRISKKDLATFHANGTKFPAHPPARLDPLVPFPSGSLGHGLSLAIGVAQGFSYLFKQKNKKAPYVYCLMSDGECNEGQVWEAVQYATAKKVKNLIVLIDSNKIQAFGRTADVLGNSAAEEKWKVFGFETYRCNGHNIKMLHKVLVKARNSLSTKPKVIVCDTVKGYGVNFMENTIEWHYNLLTEELFTKALVSLEKKIKEV